MILEQKTLKNNLDTIFVDSPGSNTATVQIWFRAGSALETKENHGVAHFLEHMFFKGTPKHPGAQIAGAVESFGGEINAFTSFDYTCYYINTPSKYLNDSVDVLLDMVSNPNFFEEDLLPERDVVFEEYRRSIDSPNQVNFFNIQKNCFSGNYAHPILGSEKHIKSFTREQLIEFRKKFYNSSNSFLVVAGDLSKKDKITQTINKYELPEGPISKTPTFKLKKESKIHTHDHTTNQLSLNFVIQAPDYAEAHSAIEDLALNCLTYGDASPLYKSLVSEDSLASSVNGSTMFFHHQGCHFLKAAMPEENFEKFITKLEKELISIFKSGFTIEQIERIRNQYISSKIYEKESIESYAFSLGHSNAQTGDLQSDEEFIERMRLATTASVHKSLLDIFSRYLHINVQYPKGSSNKKAEKRLEKFRETINKVALEIKESLHYTDFKKSEHDPALRWIDWNKNVRFIHRENNMTPTFVLHAYIKGGLSFEDEKNNGIFNLIAKNISYGYKGMEYGPLKQYLETHSAYLNGFSGKNAYGLTLHGLTADFPELSKHFFNSLFKPSFPSNYLKLEKELLKRSLHLQKEDPVKHCFKNFTELIFDKHPYAMNVMGTEKSIKGISRKAMGEMHTKMLETSEPVITYCGDLPFDSVEEAIAPYMNELKGRKAIKAKNPKINSSENERRHIEFDREQTHIMIGKKAFKISTTEDLYLKVFSTFLSGQSSELFVEVRDRLGLCYSCQPVHLTAVEAGYWGIYIGAGHDKKDAAIEAIVKILNKYQKKGLSKSDFSRVKKMILGQNLLNVQTNDDYASFYSIPALHDLGMDFQHTTLQEIQDLDHKKLNEFLSKFLKETWNIVEVGR